MYTHTHTRTRTVGAFKMVFLQWLGGGAQLQEEVAELLVSPLDGCPPGGCGAEASACFLLLFCFNPKDI